jgi:DinB superfamily
VSNNDSEFAAIFIAFSRDKLLNQHWPRLKTCVESMTVEQLWWRPNEASNSVGNLILHLNGNVTQWLVASFNKDEDKRNRPEEFAAQGGLTAAELLSRLGGTIAEAEKVLNRLTVEELLAPYVIQGRNVRGLDAVYQVIEHFGLHYGQIAYIAKSLSGKDLGFYRDLNQTGRSTGNSSNP